MISIKNYNKLCYFILTLAAIGLPTSKIILSWCTVLLIVLFIIGPNLKQRTQQIWQSSITRLILLFYLFNCIGLIWSPDPTAGLKLLKGYLPFLILPFIYVSIQLTEYQQKHIFKWFIASLLITSIYNFTYINGVWGTIVGDDIREMSRFGSHIRYALLITIGCLLLLVHIQKKTMTKQELFISIGLLSWFIYYTFYSQVLTGVLTLVSLIILFVSLFLLYKKRLVLFVIFSFILIGTSFLVIYKIYPENKAYDCSQFPISTANGNFYENQCETLSEINGLPIFAPYSPKELEQEWNKRSTIKYTENDLRNHPIRMTIPRYMTALQYPKDSLGISQLSEEDIKNIEKGKVYPAENKDLLFTRLYGIKYELMNTQNPNGKSLLQRIEHWKTSCYIIKNHFLFGTGTGGNQVAFDKAYQLTNSKLDENHRLRSHNQFFAIQIGLGVIGSLLFLLLFFQIIRKTWLKKQLFTAGFITVLIVSFLIEDTLETQVGAYIFGFFLLPILQKGLKTN